MQMRPFSEVCDQGILLPLYFDAANSHIGVWFAHTGSGELLFVAPFWNNGGGSERARGILIPNQMPLSARFMRCEVSGSIILYRFYFFQLGDHRVYVSRSAVSFYTHNNHYLQMIFACCAI